MNAEHADATWVLSIHDSDADARAAETVVSLRYGIPTIPFVARPSRIAMNSFVGSQSLIDGVFSELDTEEAGQRLLHDEGLSFERPHFSAATTTNGSRVRRRITVSLCGDRRGARPMHRIALFGYDDEGRRAVEALGLSVRPARKGSSGWRFETAHTDMGRVVEIAQTLQRELGASIRYTARLAAQTPFNGKERNSLPFMPASAVRPGMLMVTENGEFDVVTGVERVGQSE